MDCFIIRDRSEPDTELRFDSASASLKTLPVATKEQQLQTRVQDSKSVDTNLVEEAAKFLKGLLWPFISTVRLQPTNHYAPTTFYFKKKIMFLLL